ncbi:helix-turn-helix domain-containing protein [Pseudomonas sp. LPB0260]|uniref:RodZ domain-containing protein n=1 Tax=unclassified Pseudomonas TaxID=196821 RepID=UPI0015C22D5D|nr:RodZ family helix-turn-helix domain-containing protein [Pseudomonas sp. LPB0260]QLC74038.1 helix-turn-helix domain-containing protein [Pseudomonas sp. LPB0260]QLC76811.1 helix-turn-helix domain-containing protein [Pseudomonas sp. LPB0260]
MKAAHSEEAVAQQVNPGESLRITRESKGWSIAEVAAQLNLTPQRLGQIEDGAFDKLPGHTFARGYIRAYGKLLGMDQARLVLEFDQFTGSNAAGSSVHSLGRIEQPLSHSQHILRFAVLAVLVVLAGAGLYWWQEQAQRAAEEPASSFEHVEVEGADGTTQIHVLDEPEDQAVAEAQQPSELNLSATALEPAPQTDESAAESNGDAGLAEPVVAAPVAPAPSPAEPAPQAAVAPTPGEPVAPASAAEQPPVAAAGEGVVELSFSADCWTQLTDANGKILVSSLKRAGDSLRLVGKAPLELRLGFARGAQVTYNGQAVDVAPFTTGETARLKLGGQ